MTYFPTRRPAGPQRGVVSQNTPPPPLETQHQRIEVMTLDEAADRIAFQVCYLATQDHVSQTAEHLIREMVLAAMQLRGNAKGANQLSHFYATTLVALAEQLVESEYLRDEWFIRWRDDCSNN